MEGIRIHIDRLSFRDRIFEVRVIGPEGWTVCHVDGLPICLSVPCSGAGVQVESRRPNATHTDAPADDLVERLERDADAWADVCDGEDPYSAALMREAAARIRSLEAQRDEAVGLLREGLHYLPNVDGVLGRTGAFLDSLKEGRHG